MFKGVRLATAFFHFSSFPNSFTSGDDDVFSSFFFYIQFGNFSENFVFLLNLISTSSTKIFISSLFRFDCTARRTMFWSSKWWLGCCSRKEIYKLITLCNCVFIFLFFLLLLLLFSHRNDDRVLHCLCSMSN